MVEESRALRHELHRHPELGYEEHGTARRILEFIGEPAGAEIRSGVAKTGIVVTLGKELPGPCVALRADMDALAMEERSGVAWASTIPGRMHACGHDGHTAMLAGAVRLVAARSGELKGPVKFIFQPAEEGGAGGEAMVEAGVLEDPPVAAVYGLHNNLPDSREKMGPILYTPGAAMAGTGTFDIEVVGKGGHAAFPHRCIDPIYAAASLVVEIQGIVSRGVNPITPAVVSVTQFTGGTAHNIIPESVQLRGTFRALDGTVLEWLREEIVRRTEAVVAAHGGVARIRCEIGYPVLVNNERAEAVFRKILAGSGDLARLGAVSPIMGGEDFAYFAEKVPGFFYYLPACPLDREESPGCHDPCYDFNDDLLAEGIRLHVETALRFADCWA